MLNQPKESESGFSLITCAKESLNNKEAPRDQSSQKETTEIVPLEIERAYARISKNKTKDPTYAENLRWIRSNPLNKEIPLDFLLKRIIIPKIVRGGNWSYSPCCQVFSRKNPSGRGHQGVKMNAFQFLLGGSEASKARAFKQKLAVEKNSTKKKDFESELKSKLFIYFKTGSRLNKLRMLIDELPRKSGCFYLPLIKQKYEDDCPGHSLFLKPGVNLGFKVNLVSISLDDCYPPTQVPEVFRLEEKSEVEKKEVKKQEHDKNGQGLVNKFQGSSEHSRFRSMLMKSSDMLLRPEPSVRTPSLIEVDKKAKIKEEIQNSQHADKMIEEEGDITSENLDDTIVEPNMDDSAKPKFENLDGENEAHNQEEISCDSPEHKAMESESDDPEEREAYEGTSEEDQTHQDDGTPSDNLHPAPMTSEIASFGKVSFSESSSEYDEDEKYHDKILELGVLKSYKRELIQKRKDKIESLSLRMIQVGKEISEMKKKSEKLEKSL